MNYFYNLMYLKRVICSVKHCLIKKICLACFPPAEVLCQNQGTY